MTDAAKNQALATATPAQAPQQLTATPTQTPGVFSSIFAPATRSDALALCQQISREQWVPKSFRGSPMFVAIALEFGERFGLSPMSSLTNIAMINGKPSLYGDIALAVCRKSDPSMHYSEEYQYSGDGPQRICTGCTVTVQRSGCEAHVEQFTRSHAERANLLSKDGPWRTYPQRMYMARARGYALRTAFPDVLMGFITSEEAEDYQHGNLARQRSQPHPAKVVDAPAPAPAPELTSHNDVPEATPKLTLEQFLGMIEDAQSPAELQSMAQERGVELSDADKAAAKDAYRARLSLLQEQTADMIAAIKANEAERASRTQELSEELDTTAEPDYGLPGEDDMPSPDMWDDNEE